MRICNLREKQVINSVDCKILGYVQDVEFDLCSGEYVIPFECIVNVGPDVILVNVCPEKIIVKL